MSLNEPLDFKSQTKGRRSEPERTAKKHAKNKRQKTKRAASPTSSYLSMRTDWSMDPPTNFEGGDTFPLHSRIKRRRETSPVTSYISLKSDDPMNVSKASESDLRVRAASPTPTYLSLRTDWSIDPPTNFKTAEMFPLDPRLLTEQHLRCPVCKSLLKDPVSIPCGHNYCSGCINAFWDTCAGEYVCPHCGKASETRPVLNTNAALAEVVKNIQHAGFSPALPPQSYAGPEDVACDLCSERRLKSVKSCSTCGVSLCETHVRQHYTVPALQKHTLCDVTGDTKTRPSLQQRNKDNSFKSSASGQQHHADTQDIIKCPEFSDTPGATTPVTDEPEPTAGAEPDTATIIAAVRKETESGISPEPKDNSNQEMAVATKLQTRLKRSAKTFRPKTKEKKENVKSLALICSTLQQEMSGLREKLSKLETKNSKKEKYEDEEDYGEEYDTEEDKEEDDDDYGDEEEYEEGDDDCGDEDEDEDEEEYEEEDYGDDGDYNEDYSEKGSDAESDEEESDEHSFDDEYGYKDDYDDEENEWKENEDEEDYHDEDNSEEDIDKYSYDSNDY